MRIEVDTKYNICDVVTYEYYVYDREGEHKTVTLEGQIAEIVVSMDICDKAPIVYYILTSTNDRRIKEKSDGTLLGVGVLDVLDKEFLNYEKL